MAKRCGTTLRGRGLRRQQLNRTGIRNLAVKYQERGEPIVGVVDRVRLVATADGCFWDRLLGGEAARRIPDQQGVRRVLAIEPAADNIDVRVIVAVDIADRECPGALNS